MQSGSEAADLREDGFELLARDGEARLEKAVEGGQVRVGERGWAVADDSAEPTKNCGRTRRRLPNGQ